MKVVTKCCRVCSPSLTISIPARSWSSRDNRKASRLPASNSSLDSFQGDHRVSGCASQEGFGKLPAVDVGNHVFIVISLLYGFSKARN